LVVVLAHTAALRLAILNEHLPGWGTNDANDAFLRARSVLKDGASNGGFVKGAFGPRTRVERRVEGFYGFGKARSSRTVLIQSRLRQSVTEVIE
jgi:hypothetical protein